MSLTEMIGKGYAYYAVDTYEVFWRCVFNDKALDQLNEVVAPNGSNFTEDVISTFTSQSEYVKQGYGIWENLFNDLWLSRYDVLRRAFFFPEQTLTRQHIHDPTCLGTTSWAWDSALLW